MTLIIRYSLPDGKAAPFETEANAIIIGRNPCSDSTANLDLESDDNSGFRCEEFFGSRQRMAYTVNRDAVNKASRICGGAGPGEIVIGEPVFTQVYGIVDLDT
ncbi:MAG: hypothetical protein GY697_19225 [Desulfobacterales bacterium]|nr:hypothetical protein [Desulfobacterales bacterium]